MPLFAHAVTGEGIRVDPAPYRPKLQLSTKKVKRLRMYRVWLDYQARGLSLRDIAELVDKPVWTVQRGIAEFISHYRRIVASRLPGRVPDVVPAFGCGQYTPDHANEQLGHCRHCNNPIKWETLACPYCWGLSATNEEILLRQTAREEGRRQRTDANREKAGPPSPELVARWEELEAIEKAEREAKTPAKPKRKAAPLPARAG